MPIVLDGQEIFAARLNAAMAPWMTEDLQEYNVAVSSMFEQIAALVVDQGFDGGPMPLPSQTTVGGVGVPGYVPFMPGWGALLDPDYCPTAFLPYLGQFVGVGSLIGVGDPLARATIKARPAFTRGTPASIIAAAQATLTGTQTVTLTERYLGDPYQIQVLTYAAETPSYAQTLAAINTVKPGGILLTYSLSVGWTIAQMEAHFAGQTIGAVESTYSTLTQFESQIGG